MKKLLLIPFLLATTLSFGQKKTFDEGYFIGNNGEKTSCLIHNKEWSNTPTAFEYKLSETSEVKSASIEDVQEFGAGSTFRYIRRTVEIDRSSPNIGEMDYDKNPSFKSETIYLKVIVESKATLYSYNDGNIVRFFYEIDDSEIKQLVHKKYLTYEEGKLAENNNFRNQLYTVLKCPSFTTGQFENLTYNRSELTSLFIKYNECINQPLTNFDAKEKKTEFNFTLRPGLNSSSLFLRSSISRPREFDFGNKFTFRIGFEIEIVIHLNRNNKLAMLLEPTYQYYNAKKEFARQTVQVNYPSIEFPIGIRYKYYFNEQFAIFLNGSFIAIDLPLNASVTYDNPDNVIEIYSRNNFAFGIGSKYKKFSLEFRYQTKREMQGPGTGLIFFGSDYQTTALIFGYTL
jgi:hypothetical protein